MEIKNITITVSGVPNSGKSRFLFLLKKFLNENEFDVNHNVSKDFVSEEHFDTTIGKNFNQVINELKVRRTITLQELYENKQISKN